MSDSLQPDASWDRVTSELRAHRDAQEAAWGSIDNVTLGRYLADEVTGDERQRVEQAMDDLPELRMLTELVRNVLTEFEPVPLPTPVVSAPAAAVTLSFAEHAARRAASMPARRTRSFGKTFRQRAVLAAAACLLLTMGVVLQSLSQSGSSLPSADSFAMSAGRADRTAGSPSGTFTVSEKPNDLTAVPPAMQLAQLDRQVESLETQGRFREALVVARRLPVVARQAKLDQDPRYANTLNRVGNLCERGGDLDGAVANYAQAHTINRTNLGEEHPTTIQSLNLLAKAYRSELISETSTNGSSVTNATGPYTITGGLPMAIPGNIRPDSGPHPVANTHPESPYASLLDAKKDDGKAKGAPGLYGPDKFGRRQPREIIPVLTQALQHASKTEDRVANIQALGRLGAAARDSVPLLAERMNCTKDVAEQEAIVTALVEMGVPESVSALDHLVARGESQLREQTRGAVQLACCGIQDNCALFSAQKTFESRRAMLDLARKNGPALYVATLPTERKDLEGSKDQTFYDKRKADRMVRALQGIEGISLVLTPAGGVEIFVSDALRQRGFTLNRQTELQTLLDKHLQKQDFDGALTECVQFLARLDLKTKK